METAYVPCVSTCGGACAKRVGGVAGSTCVHSQDPRSFAPGDSMTRDTPASVPLPELPVRFSGPAVLAGSISSHILPW